MPLCSIQYVQVVAWVAFVVPTHGSESGCGAHCSLFVPCALGSSYLSIVLSPPQHSAFPDCLESAFRQKLLSIFASRFFFHLQTVTHIMAAPPLAEPRARLEELDRVIKLHEGQYRTGIKFSQRENESGAKRFLDIYLSILNVLYSARKEEYREDVVGDLKDDLKNIFERIYRLLDWSALYVAKCDVRLTPVHKELHEAAIEFARKADHRDELFRHTMQMNERLDRIRPSVAIAWNADGSDFKPSDEFEAIYQQFEQLEKDPNNFQQEQERYVYKSYDLLQCALRALRLPEYFADPEEEEDNFFYNETRPTYVEFPYGSDEFLYGFDRRRGILEVRAILGALPREQELKVNWTHKLAKIHFKSQLPRGLAQAEKTPLEAKAVESRKRSKKGTSLGPTPPSTKKGHKKRPAEAESSKGKGKGKAKASRSRAPKRPRTGWGYTMTLVNAAADVEDILRDNQYKSVKDPEVRRPDSDRLVTPTVEIRKDLMVRYYGDYRAIVDELYKRKFGNPTSTDKLPQSAEERKAWLERGEKELRLARNSVKLAMNDATTNAKAKELRLEAYRLKLCRAIYTLGLLSGSPAASDEEIENGLKERLLDWILYEEAWNASELVNLQRQGTSQELFDTIIGHIDERVDNIQQWLEMLEELDEGGPVAGRGGDDADDGDDPLADDDEELEEEEVVEVMEEEEEEEEAEEEEGEEEEDEDVDEEDVYGLDPDDEDVYVEDADEDDADALITGASSSSPSSQPSAPKGIVLTHEEIIKAEQVLHQALNPQWRPDAGDYLLDAREEGRRRRWFAAMADAKIANRPIPRWTHRKPFDIFADGGPPGWRDMPKDTMWDRMQYMWVLTYWRFWQLRELDP